MVWFVSFLRYYFLVLKSWLRLLVKICTDLETPMIHEAPGILSRLYLFGINLIRTCGTYPVCGKQIIWGMCVIETHLGSELIRWMIICIFWKRKRVDNSKFVVGALKVSFIFF